MRQKSLLFISIVLLFIFNSQAKLDADLPALPVDSAIKLINEKNDSDLSFWQKTKSFFGFGNEEDIKEAHENTIEDNNNLEVDLSANNIPPLPVKNLEGDPSVEQSEKPIASTKDLPTAPDQSVDYELNNETRNEPLFIPKGFEDEEGVKLPSGFSENDIEKQEAVLMPKENGEPISSQNTPTILTEKNKESPDGAKEEIEESIESVKIPDGFGDNIETSEPSSLEKPESLIQTNKEELLEGAKIKIQTSPTVIKVDSTNDNEITLPEMDDSEDSMAKTEPVVKEAIPIPTYASDLEIPKESETNISKFTKTFERKQSNQIELPKITEEDFVANDNGETIKQESIELDTKQLQFVNNEAQVLILPNDDVVLGQITTQAKINDMDLHSYIKRFWKNYEVLKREPKKEQMEQFIENYDENFNEEKFI